LKSPSKRLLFDPGISPHNSQTSIFFTLKADYKDSTKMEDRSPGITDMNMLFEALSSKFSSETDKITKNFQQVVDEHDEFHQEVRAESDELRHLLNLSQISQESPPATRAASLEPQVSAASVTPQVPTLSSSSAATNSSQDIQMQMMILMTESFSNYQVLSWKIKMMQKLSGQNSMEMQKSFTCGFLDL